MLGTLLVIVWGAYVRASGSGAGCGSHWPLCNGQIVPLNPSVKMMVEFSHRATSGILFLCIVGLCVASFLATKDRFVRRAVFASAVLVITEALIGAGLVLFELVAHDASMKRALSMSLHLTNTLLLLAVLTASTWALYDKPAPDFQANRPALLALAPAFVMFMLVGATGAVAALGDTLYPAASLRAGLQQELSPAASTILKLRPLHPLIAIAGAVVTLLSTLFVRRKVKDPFVQRIATLVLSLLLAQVLCGVLNVALLAPTWLQLLHLVLADALWIALVVFALSACAGSDARSTPSLSSQPLGARSGATR